MELSSSLPPPDVPWLSYTWTVLVHAVAGQGAKGSDSWTPERITVVTGTANPVGGVSVLCTLPRGAVVRSLQGTSPGCGLCLSSTAGTQVLLWSRKGRA